MPALSKARIAAARRRADTHQAEQVLYDLAGFYCRIQPRVMGLPPGHPGGKRGGRITFGLRYRTRDPANPARWLNRKAVIAEYAADTDTDDQIRSARAVALEWRALVAKGIDPQAAQQRAQDERERAVSVETAAREFLRQWARPRHGDGGREAERIIDVYVVPAIGHRPMAEIATDRLALHRLLRSVADGRANHPRTGARIGGPYMANRCHALLHKFFRWAVGAGYLDRNPLADTDKPSRETARSRPLTDDEIRAIWRAASTLGYPRSHYLRALFLTGRRAGKVATMRRGEMTMAGSGGTIPAWSPAGDAANKLAPPLPLGPALAALVTECATNGDYLFQARHVRRNGLYEIVERGDRPINQSSSELVAIVNAAIEAGGGHPPPGWRLNDIRHTVRTRLGDLGIPDEIAKRVTGHKLTGIDRVYDHSKRLGLVLPALDRWHETLAGIVNPPVD